MPHGETYSGLYEFFEGNLYATVELKDIGEGWVSEWWVSRKLDDGLGVQLLGYFRIPVFGEMKEHAKLRLGFIYEDVVNFAATVAGGLGSVGAGNDVAGARKHCKAHLQTWGDLLSGTRTSRTADLYLFAVDFGVNNPAALIAEVEVVGVRTIHERIAHARRIGILDSYGRGRTSYGGDSSSEDGSSSRGFEEEGGFDIFGKTELGFKHRNSDGEWV